MTTRWLALGIERDLPKDVRASVAAQRRRRREKRKRENAARRAAERDAARVQKRVKRERRRPLHRGDYLVAGACRSEERRDACERLDVGDSVELEREPDNRHDPNAILILSESGDELGYVPREHARVMAPLLDAGADYEASVKKLWERNDGGIVPIVVSVLRNADGDVPPASRLASGQPFSPRDDPNVVSVQRHEDPIASTSSSKRQPPPLESDACAVASCWCARRSAVLRSAHLDRALRRVTGQELDHAPGCRPRGATASSARHVYQGGTRRAFTVRRRAPSQGKRRRRPRANRVPWRRSSRLFAMSCSGASRHTRPGQIMKDG